MNRLSRRENDLTGDNEFAPTLTGMAWSEIGFMERSNETARTANCTHPLSLSEKVSFRGFVGSKTWRSLQRTGVHAMLRKKLRE